MAHKKREKTEILYSPMTLDYYISQVVFCQYPAGKLSRRQPPCAHRRCAEKRGSRGFPASLKAPLLCEMFAFLFTKASVLCILYKDSYAETLW